MNSLTLFIYFAGVISNISFVLIMVSLVLIGRAVIPPFIEWLHGCDNPPHRISLLPVMVLWLIAALVPAEKTLYMMAASEIGEEIINTEEMNKVRTIINDKLDELLEEEED